jgi:hypothetical protein
MTPGERAYEAEIWRRAKMQSGAHPERFAEQFRKEMDEERERERIREYERTTGKGYPGYNW